jgi:hypothetical protein
MCDLIDAGRAVTDEAVSQGLELQAWSGWSRYPARNLHQPQIDQIAGTLMMVRSPRVWSCSRLALTSSTQASTASRLGNS